ncbi:MAG: hypothetical protein JSV98_10790, partial [candidate division WOR-3 bacterium]
QFLQIPNHKQQIPNKSKYSNLNYQNSQNGINEINGNSGISENNATNRRNETSEIASVVSLPRNDKKPPRHCEESGLGGRRGNLRN